MKSHYQALIITTAVIIIMFIMLNMIKCSSPGDAKHPPADATSPIRDKPITKNDLEDMLKPKWNDVIIRSSTTSCIASSIENYGFSKIQAEVFCSCGIGKAKTKIEDPLHLTKQDVLTMTDIYISCMKELNLTPKKTP